LAFLAITTSPTSDVERHRSNITHLNEFNITSRLDNLACNFVSQDQSSWSGRSASNHMLIAPTNVRGDDLQDHAVLTLTITQN
jgi:hypothetical protein